MKKKVIVGGTVVLPQGEMPCSVLIGTDGRVESIHGVNVQFDEDVFEVVRADGCIVLPGGIDAHVHLVDGYDADDIRPADDCYTGTLAALAGGTTTVVDFISSSADQKETARQSIDDKLERAKNCVADYAFQYSFTERYAEELKDLPYMREKGIGAFKVFTYYNDAMLDRGAIREVMRAVKDRGIVKVHAEAEDIIRRCEEDNDAQGNAQIVSHALTRPAIAELVSVRDVVALAKETGARVCIAHVSAGATLEEKRHETMLGGGFFTETCPHYTAYTLQRMQQPDGVLFTMAPPLRESRDAERIWQGLLQGEVDLYATDHCPFWKRKKIAGAHNYHTVPYGVDGIQTRMHYLFSEGVVKRGMPLQRFVELTSANAAKYHGMYPQKGCIQPGSDADLVILDPRPKWVYTDRDIVGGCDYTIYEGWEFTGKIREVYSRGERVFHNGVVCAEKGRGRYIPYGASEGECT